MHESCLQIKRFLQKHTFIFANFGKQRSQTNEQNYDFGLNSATLKIDLVHFVYEGFWTCLLFVDDTKKSLLKLKKIYFDKFLDQTVHYRWKLRVTSPSLQIWTYFTLN